jgi:hypothetical protein
MFEEYGLTEGNSVANWQFKMKSTVKNHLMIIGKMHTTNQREVLERIQEVNALLNSFMMNQATPHLRAWSCLINDKSNNRYGQSMMKNLYSSWGLKYGKLKWVIESDD